MISKAEVSVIIYRRLHLLGKTLDEKDFTPRCEELFYLLKQIEKITPLMKTESE